MTTVTTIEFAGRTIDLAKALPLRLRDYRALERKGINVDRAMTAIEGGELEGIFQVTLFILQKADGGATLEAELDALLPEQLNDLWAHIGEIGKALKAAELPFVPSSTSSGAPTDGAPRTS